MNFEEYFKLWLDRLGEERYNAWALDNQFKALIYSAGQKKDKRDELVFYTCDDVFNACAIEVMHLCEAIYTQSVYISVEDLHREGRGSSLNKLTVGGYGEGSSRINPVTFDIVKTLSERTVHVVQSNASVLTQQEYLLLGAAVQFYLQATKVEERDSVRQKGLAGIQNSLYTQELNDRPNSIKTKIMEEVFSGVSEEDKQNYLSKWSYW